MRSEYSLIVALLGAATVVAACGEEDSLNPQDSALTAIEVQAMGDALVGGASMAFDGGIVELNQVTWDLGTSTITLSVDLSWPCEAGMMDVSGITTATLDFQTGSVTAVSEAVLTPQACRFTHTPLGQNITMTGDPDVRVDGVLTAEQFGGAAVSGRMTGVVLWEAEDGRSGRCEIDVTLEWTLDDNQLEWTLDDNQTVTGTVCGMDYQGP
jgi:hypothetical protein